MSPRKQTASSRSLQKALASLEACDRDELLRHWQKFYQTPPPAFLSKPLMVRAVAYKLQEQAHGCLKTAVKRILEKTAVQDVGEAKPFKPLLSVKPGTRLVREWHGQVYEVIVAHDGVLLDGVHLRSLTEAATRITGSKWSGPRFFGLVKGR